MKKVFLFIISLAIGIPLVIWVYHKIGLAGAFSQLKILNWWQVSVLFLLTFINVFVWIFRWRLILKALGWNIHFKNLASARIGELAISYLTPGIQYGGEVVRIIALKKSKVGSLSVGIISVILDRLAEAVGFCIFLFLGAIIFLFTKSFVWASFLLILGLFTLFLLVLVFKFWGLSKILGFFAKLFRLEKIKRFDRSGKIVSWAEKVRFIGRESSNFFKKSPRAVYQAIGLSCFSLIIGAVQLAFFVYFIGQSLFLLNALPMRILISLSGFIPIPADLGVYEGVSALVFRSFGFTAGTGLSFTLMMRFIDFSLVAVGLSLVAGYFTEALFKFSRGLWNNHR